MTTTIPRAGDCGACGVPTADHFDKKNRKLSCAEAARRQQPVHRRYFASAKKEEAARDEFMTTEQVRQHLNLGSVDVVYRMVRDYRLPRVKVGPVYRFSKLAVDRWIAAQNPEVTPFEVLRGGRS